MPNDKTHNPREVAVALAKHIQVKLEEAAKQIQASREREVRKVDQRKGILAKAELCLLCGEADRPGSCTCTLQKFERRLVGGGVDHRSIDSKPTPDGKHAEVKFTAHKVPMVQTVPHNKVGALLAGRGVPEDLSDAFQGAHDAKIRKEEDIFAAAKKDCKTCGSQGVKVRQDGGLVTHPQPGKEKGLCNGIRMIKEEMEKTLESPETLLFEDKEPKVLHPSDKKNKKPVKKSEKLQKDMGEPRLPGMTPRKNAGPHPETAAALADVKAVAPSNSWKKQGLPGLKSRLAATAATRTTPPRAAAPAVTGPLAAVRNDANAAATPIASVRGDMNLAADKKAAGVGFLNNLITRFKGIGNATWAQVGNGNANRIGVGMSALARTEKNEIEGYGPSAPMMMSKTEAMGTGKDDMGRCLHCRKNEHGGACAPLSKLAVAPGTGGLDSVNHNQTLIRNRAK